jgi:hypothetical protein
MRAHGGRLEASQQAREIRLHFPDRRVSG